MNKYVMLGAAVAGLAVAYMIYKGAGKAVELAGEAAQAVNPFNNDNIINKAANGVYGAVTGSSGSIGTDIYDGVQKVKGVINDDSWSIGTKIYDWMH